MKINVKSQVLNYKGEPVVEPGRTEPLTVLDVFITALNATVGPEVIPAEKKNQIYQISRKIYQNNEPDFTVNELALIQERVLIVWSPMVVGYTMEVLEGRTPAPAISPESVS